MELEPTDGRDVRTRLEGRGEDLGPAVDRDHGPVPAPTTGAFEQVDRDVRTTGPDVEHCELGPVCGECIDRGLAQARATEPAVDPPEIAQVAEQGRQVVERSVEQLDAVGHA